MYALLELLRNVSAQVHLALLKWKFLVAPILEALQYTANAKTRAGTINNQLINGLID